MAICDSTIASLISTPFPNLPSSTSISLVNTILCHVLLSEYSLHWDPIVLVYNSFLAKSQRRMGQRMNIRPRFPVGSVTDNYNPICIVATSTLTKNLEGSFTWIQLHNQWSHWRNCKRNQVSIVCFNDLLFSHDFLLRSRTKLVPFSMGYARQCW